MMGINNPGATSTPTAVPPVRGRKGIRDSNSIQSPIANSEDTEDSEYEFYQGGVARQRTLSPNHRSPSGSPRYRTPPHGSPTMRKSVPLHCTDDSSSDALDTEDDEPEEYTHRQTRTLPDNSNRGVVIVCLMSLFIAAVGCIWYLPRSYDSNSLPPNLPVIYKTLKSEFSKQQKDFFRQIKVSIEEVVLLDQPRTILFIYEGKAQNTLDNILKKVSHSAICYLTECSNLPVLIKGSDLNRTSIINDYGIVIAKYRGELEENGVMIVNNLEEIPGKVAQAFHSFCDDYNPIVRKALILFTLKVDKLPDGYPMSFVEKLLLELWKDLGRDDKFYPLFTRISGTILLVEQE